MATFVGKATNNTRQIPSNQTNFVEFIDLSTMPQNFWENVKDGGGDIRLYKDSDFTQELPREIVSCDLSAQTGQVWYQHNLSVGDIVYIDVDGVRDDYAANDVYGQYNVFPEEYKIVSHSGGGPDSTSNQNNGTSYGGVNTGGAQGKTGAATRYDGSDDYVRFQNTISSGDFTWSFWVDVRIFQNFSGIVNNYEPDNRRGLGLYMIDTNIRNFRIQSNANGSSTPIVFAESKIDLVVSGNGVKLYIDGNEQTSLSITPAFKNFIDIGLYNGNHGNLIACNFENVNFAKSQQRIDSEYANQNTPENFRTWRVQNTSPTATDDTVTTQYETPVMIDVLANDTDPDGDPLTLQNIAAQPANGTASIQDEQILYTPNNGFSGQDSFTYEVSDGKGGTDIGMVTVTVEEPVSAVNPLSAFGGI